MATSSSSSSSSNALPHIHLLCMQPRFAKAFEEARRKYGLPSSIQVTIHDVALNQVPDTVRFDTIVSPANSYGRLDGAFDDAISRAISPSDDYLGLTRAAQAQLYEHWRGFAPPGSCTLIHVPDEFHARSRNVWGVRRLALCPTMRLPSEATWNREVVYECLWSMLCAVDRHNRAAAAAAGAPDGDATRDPVRSVLMTPLGTGVGHITPQRWAAQAVLALKHYHDSLERPHVWSSLDWDTSGSHSLEVQKTWMAEEMENRRL